MAVERKCPTCGGMVTVPDALAEQAFRCPACGAVGGMGSGPKTSTVTERVNGPELNNGDAPGAVPSVPATRPCPFCFESVPVNAEKCHFCGEDPRGTP